MAGSARSLAQASATPPDVHPNVSEVFRAKVARLAETLNDPADRAQAAQAIRNLIARVVLSPDPELRRDQGNSGRRVGDDPGVGGATDHEHRKNEDARCVGLGGCGGMQPLPYSPRLLPPLPRSSQPHDRHQEQSGDLGSWRAPKVTCTETSSSSAWPHRSGARLRSAPCPCVGRNSWPTTGRLRTPLPFLRPPALSRVSQLSCSRRR